MKAINNSIIRCILIPVIFTVSLKAGGQTLMPEELNSSSLKEQLKYLEEKTRIYENYRAIREDMFQKLKTNVSDSVSLMNNTVTDLNKKTSSLRHTIDSLNNTLSITKSSLKDMTTTKNSIKVIGLEVNKTTYNSIMWAIIAGLFALLGIGFLIFKRNLSVTSDIKKELRDIKNESEAYRKTTREAREKMSMDHFNEIKRLKGG